jgi:hypothetical protein
LPNEAPNGRRPPESVVGAIVQLLESVRDWRRTGILLILGGAALLGAIVWQARERLVAAMTAFLEAPPHVVLADVALLESTALGLVSPIRPDYGVAVWSVDLERNRRRLLVWAPGDAPIGPDLQKELTPGYVAPLFIRRPGVDNVLLLAVLDGETACGEPITTYQGRIPYACAAGIPPGPGPLLGLLTALFPKPLSDHDQATTRSALQHAAETLTVYQ